MRGYLEFKNGKKFTGTSFGADVSVAGEVVFTTGMTGYPEALTDPSYRGQILVFSYPLLGSYGVPDKQVWESERVEAAGVIVSDYIDTPSHHASMRSLSAWLRSSGVPLLQVKDTRALIEMLRDSGSLLGRIEIKGKVPFTDPNRRNLVAEVSVNKVLVHGRGKKNVVLVDCGAKANIRRELVKRGVKVTTVPWDFDPVGSGLRFDGLVISNGPGDPKMVPETVAAVRAVMDRNIPVFGICLGNQILALAAGGDTYKLKFGHRGHNQPCRVIGTEQSCLTTQNHGYAVGKIPPGFREWFRNGNDGTNEGLIHKSKPFMSVQFHPESSPGPNDTSWIFDDFLKLIK